MWYIQILQYALMRQTTVNVSQMALFCIFKAYEDEASRMSRHTELSAFF